MTEAARRARRAAVPALLAAALALPGIPAADAAPHAFDEGECLGCHPSRPGEGVERPPATVGRIHAACVKCHSPCDPWRMHADAGGDPATMRLPLPLDDAGAMDCRTCHVAHAAAGAGPRAVNLLRIPNLRRELCLNCHQQRPPRASVRVVSPPPGVTAPGVQVMLAGTATDLDDGELFARVNGAAFPLPLRGTAFSTWITLSEGMNRIEVLADGVELWGTDVYHPGAPAGSTAYQRLHLGHLTARGECGDCHGDTSSGFGDAAPPTDSTLCYRCHDRFEGKRYLHGPVAVGACLSCHDPHGGVTEAALLEERSSLCLSCHDRGDVRHCVTDPRDGSPECTACHDPHASDARYFRRSDRPRPRGPGR